MRCSQCGELDREQTERYAAPMQRGRAIQSSVFGQRHNAATGSLYLGMSGALLLSLGCAATKPVVSAPVTASLAQTDDGRCRPLHAFRRMAKWKQGPFNEREEGRALRLVRGPEKLYVSTWTHNASGAIHEIRPQGLALADALKEEMERSEALAPPRAEDARSYRARRSEA